jgi:hypothetical protein
MIDSRASIFVVVLASCTETKVHDTPQAKSETCVTCHAAAYARAPDHHDDAGVATKPDTCADCHTTTAWIPATAGHPEDLFPITTGSHANPAIGCTDCHNPALGESTAGANTDCIHCHIGAHQAPSIDDTHAACLTVQGDAGCSGYTPSGSAASPNYCLSCHPKG